MKIMIHDVMMTMIMKSDEDHFDRGAWWPSGSALAFRSEGRGFGPAGRHAISPAWGPRRCSVPGRAWLAEFVGSADPQVSERGIGVVGHASSLNDHSDRIPVSVGSCDLKTVGKAL